VKKLATAGLSLMVVFAFVATTAAPALARSRRHNRNHLHCGVGTVRQGNRCVPDTTTPTPPGPNLTVPQGSISISPATVRMTPTTIAGAGAWIQTFTISGLPAFEPVTVQPFSGAACPISGGISLTSDSTGRIVVQLGNFGNCFPGVYAINVVEAVAPGALFTAFIRTTF
jgi:hypothetical protein